MSDQGNVLLAIRRARWRAGLPGLLTDPELMADAQWRAGQLRGDFSHDHAGDRLSRWFWGEIIGWTDQVSGYAAADHVVRLWLDSPPHRAVLLGTWRRLGVGAVERGGRIWWVAVFGHR